MAILNKKLYTETENFEIATTKEELSSSESVAVEIDGIKAYIGLDEDISLSKLKIEKDKKYAVKKEAAPPVVPGSQNYLTPGSYTFTAPYTTEYTVEVAGGGGGGGGSGYSKDYGKHMAYGGSGGTGEIIATTISLECATTCNIVVGSGGNAGKNMAYIPPASSGSAGTGEAGKTSSFATISAKGGSGGTGGWYKYKNRRANWSNGSNGTSYGQGGRGGGSDSNGSPGWVKISWG